MADETLRERARKLYRPPFRYTHGYIFDADGEMLADNRPEDPGAVLRVRGWGRLANVAKSGDEAASLQDAYGELLAEALTKFWNDRRSSPPAEGGAAAIAGSDYKEGAVTGATVSDPASCWVACGTCKMLMPRNWSKCTACGGTPADGTGGSGT